jgi:hypothetical protein
MPVAEGDFFYTNFAKGEFQKGNIALLTGTIKIALFGATPDIDADEYFDDLASEIVASGYTAGGVTLGTKTVTVDDTNDWADFDCANPTWATLATATILAAVVYVDTGTPATSTVIGWYTIATNSNGGPYTLNVPTAGLLRFA